MHQTRDERNKMKCGSSNGMDVELSTDHVYALKIIHFKPNIFIKSMLLLIVNDPGYLYLISLNRHLKF